MTHSNLTIPSKEGLTIWSDATCIGALMCMAKTLSDKELAFFFDSETERLMIQGFEPETIVRNLKAIRRVIYALRDDLKAPVEPPQNKPPEKPVEE